ncbi:DUF485 domain-containing protein [Bacillus sp. ISL-7]|uniref:DUF485 domain-containing protein n=1 Tax=Bacillus sp. ISL-7 TaxID=2819136 RepID=UPI001BE5AA85|nr:DUF485 domain-containing protein [Bacillus sp. ISL-7]MBT2735732.1 DUF485 domain-containing protein [Bacillus sp. ISL-7]
MESPVKKSYLTEEHVEKKPYYLLVETEDFKDLLQKKKAFIIPVTTFFLTFYFVLPVLAAYTYLLKGEAFLGITWAWVYALLQFVVVWIGGIVYLKKSEKYDKMAQNILTKYRKELG